MEIEQINNQWRGRRKLGQLSLFALLCLCLLTGCFRQTDTVSQPQQSTDSQTQQSTDPQTATTPPLIAADEPYAVAEQSGSTQSVSPARECAPAATAEAAEARALYYSVWENLRRNYMYPEELEDWHERLNSHDCEINTMSDALAFARELASSLGDPYTLVHDSNEAEAFSQSLEDMSEDEITVTRYADHICSMRIASFLSFAFLDELRTELAALADCRGLIVDLRDNPGGLMYNAIMGATMFLDFGVICQVESRFPGGGHSVETFMLSETEMLYGLSSPDIDEESTDRTPRFENMNGNRPVVIIVNGNTASAAELFAGALTDNAAYVTVIGTTTFGKGIGQNVLPLSSGVELHVTTLEYRLPSGRWIGDGDDERYGIVPDIVVENAVGDDGTVQDYQLAYAVGHLRSQIIQ